MKKKTSKQDLKDLPYKRSVFALKAYSYVSSMNYRQSMLFNAGDIGFCLIEWDGMKWNSTWLDKALDIARWHLEAKDF